MNKKSFGSRVHDARKMVKMTSDRLSELCECTPVSIRQIESGTRLPSIPKLISICNTLNITPNYLFAPELTFDISNANFTDYEVELEQTIRELRRLAPTQAHIVCATIKTLIEQIDK